MRGFDFTPDRETILPGFDRPAADKDAAESKPHYHDHRQRLRARFDSAGPGALADYELLELLLFRTIPRRDTKPLAKALLTQFGDLGAVLAADPLRLQEVDGVGAGVAQDLKAMHAAFVRIAASAAKQRPIVSSWSQLLSYCRLALQHETREQFRVLFLDVKNHLIADDVMGEGTIDSAPVYPREVARRALERAAASVILVHNHPSGDPKPSSADIAITREIAAALKTIGVAVHDHLVIGRKDVTSFKSLGLL